MSTSEFKSLKLVIASRKQELAKFQELKRKEMAPLIKKHNELATKIYEKMKSQNLKKLDGIDIEQVTPKEKPKKITHKEKIFKLREMGIRNPEGALEELGW